MNFATNSASETPLAEFFRSLPGRHRPERTEGWSTVVHFNFKGSTEALWTVVIHEGVVQVSAGHEGIPRCTVTTTEGVFLDVVSGQQSPEMAFFSGKVKVSSPPVMLRFLKSFSRHKEA